MDEKSKRVMEEMNLEDMLSMAGRVQEFTNQGEYALALFVLDNAYNPSVRTNALYVGIACAITGDISDEMDPMQKQLAEKLLSYCKSKCNYLFEE